MQEFLWVEKYRPKTVDDTILPSEIKKTLNTFVQQKNVPNLLLSGGPGIGKTTSAKAVLNEIGADVKVINASKDGGIDTLRNDIQQFASSMSLKGGRKYVILDEADYLNPNSTQPALRNFMEEFSKNCGFILTCNLKDRIIDPLQSRCSLISFQIPKDEGDKLALEFFKRAKVILTKEGVEFDAKALAAAVKVFFPDWRRCLNELQRYSAVGKIDSGIIAARNHNIFKPLIASMKGKRFSEIRSWVSENLDIDSAYLYSRLYDMLPDMLANESSVADAINILAEYQYKEAFVANSAINRSAALAMIMATVQWK
jgi:DNA polymerase III delta prime subunit